MIKRTFIALICMAALFSSSLILAQNPLQPYIEYGYDLTGNRNSCVIVWPLIKTSEVMADSNLSIQLYTAALNQTAMQASEMEHQQASITDNLGSRLIKLYPNPTYGVLTFQISPFPEGEKVEVRVFDQQNRFLFTTPCVSEYTRVDLSGYATGVYLVYVAMGDQVSNWKIVKE